ncbi:MAG: hypothetical protein PUD15_07480 [Prevotella sp.]|nr:hypothetical protein [Prevotella sp.]
MELPIVKSILWGELRPNIFFSSRKEEEIKVIERQARNLPLNSDLIELEKAISRLLLGIVNVRRCYQNDKDQRDAAIEGRSLGMFREENCNFFDKETIFSGVISINAINNPRLRFYDQLLKAERVRTRLAFHYLNMALRCDADLRTEVRKTLRLISNACKEAVNSDFTALASLITAHLTELYFTLYRTYHAILSGCNDIEDSFEDFVYDWRNSDPTKEEQNAYNEQCGIVVNIDKKLLDANKADQEKSSTQISKEDENRPKDKADKFLDAVALYNFLGMPQIKKIMELKKMEGVHKFVLKMLENPSYACAMLEFLGLYKWIKDKYERNFTKEQYDYLCSKAVLGKDNKTSFHNVRMSLNDKCKISIKDKACNYIQSVKTDYSKFLVQDTNS